jgi:Tfp pilus assembly protein PilX
MMRRAAPSAAPSAAPAATFFTRRDGQRDARPRGIVLPFTLVALVVVLLGGLALIRAMDVSLLQAGNLAFRRDLANQAERGFAQAQTLLSSGALAAEATREAHSLANNYSASRLATNAQGIPSVLVNDSAFTAAGYSAGDLSDSSTGVTVRWVIDRQCVATGSALSTNCATSARTTDSAADDRYKLVNAETQPVYRISVRATGPRNTQAFFQSTVAR